MHYIASGSIKINDITDVKIFNRFSIAITWPITDTVLYHFNYNQGTHHANTVESVAI